MKHTKGPWTVYQEANMIHKARVLSHQGDRTPVAENVSLSNAHLIAAAPEMLEKIKDVALLCEVAIEQGHNVNTQDILAIMNWCISKAQGGKV